MHAVFGTPVRESGSREPTEALTTYLSFRQCSPVDLVLYESLRQRPVWGYRNRQRDPAGFVIGRELVQVSDKFRV